MFRADTQSLCFQDYRALLEALSDARFPSPDELTRLLPAGIHNYRGSEIRFVSSDELGHVDYEHHIFQSGEVSTRPENTHDVFNALAWCRFPATKAALNARHWSAQEQSPKHRGRERDALTLFDEGGVIVTGTSRTALQSIGNHEWAAVFGSGGNSFARQYQVFIVGHGLLEKCLAPYREMTANVMLVHVNEQWSSFSRSEQCQLLDGCVAQHVSDGEVLSRTSDLAHLPLAGIPGWVSVVDASIYDDASIFRPARSDKPPALILRMPDLPSLSG